MVVLVFYSFIHLYILEILVIRSAKYKLPIIREICICMFSLYIKMKFKKEILLLAALSVKQGYRLTEGLHTALDFMLLQSTINLYRGYFFKELCSVILLKHASQAYHILFCICNIFMGYDF